ncbi:MAG: fumarylacetoacetate hydrolase family protein [Gammaproteobacteria bacterium]|nr:fumarylacetoacetate hydrolase family protein [Gammaproteobacteria bacterium]
MKLATLKGKNRDGQLVVVSKDLALACLATDIAATMQFALDHWQQCQSKLAARYDALNAGEWKDTLPFQPKELASPLPRAYQWVDGSAYVNHVELVRKARGATMPDNFWHDPLMYQGGSDTFLGPHDDIVLHDEAWGLDFEGEVAVITTDVDLGADESEAEKSICLLMLVNDISLRNLIPNELAKGFGFFHSKPSSAFSPVAVTTDELMPDWDGRKINLPLVSHLNGNLFGQPQAGCDMTFDFPRLVAHAAKTRRLSAGTIIGSGTVSNYDRSRGSSCIAEQRMLETIAEGQPKTPFMRVGDHIRIEMFDTRNHSIFGSIDQRIVGEK